MPQAVEKHSVPKIHKPKKTPPATRATKTKKTARTELKIRDLKTHTPQPNTAHKPQHPLGHLLLEKLLQEYDFAGEVVSDAHFLEEYSTDESIFSITPQLVIKPKTRKDVEVITQVVTQEKTNFPSLSITPRAAGTGLSGGSLTDSIVIDMSAHLDTIDTIRFNNNTKEAFIRVDAGVMWRDMEDALARAGYYVPTYTSSKDICSVGGAVGNNAAGAETLRYGHCVDWIDSLDVVLQDGHTYTVEPLTYKQYVALSKKKHEYARILKGIFALIEDEEATLKKNKPHTKKNTAGYDVWNILPQGVKAFKKGDGKINPLHLIAGSQGTLGIVTSITMRAIPLAKNNTTIFVPVFDLAEAATVIDKAKSYTPIEMEVFDDHTFDLALKNPDFFKKRLDGMMYYRTMLSMYTLYHVRLARKIPQLMMLITVDETTAEKYGADAIAKDISGAKNKARILSNPVEEQMLWQIRRASYSLSKLQDETKRPAAFLEDITVPTKYLSRYFMEVKKLFKEFNIQATVHGHAGNGHFHFYPLLDFTQKSTPLLIEKMSERFFAIAIRYEGSLCGEHNDGIIRTPHIHKMFSKKMISLFETIESLFDPQDIFNPGKKVHPRFEIRDVLRTSNK